MVAKAAGVKKIPFTCEITDLPGKKNFLIKNISNPGLGLHIYKFQCTGWKARAPFWGGGAKNMNT